MTSTNTFVFRPSNTRFMDFHQGPSRPSMMWNNQLDAVLPKRQKPTPDQDGFVQPKHRSKARGHVSANQEIASQNSNKFKVLDNKHANKEPQEEGSQHTTVPSRRLVHGHVLFPQKRGHTSQETNHQTGNQVQPLGG